MRCGCPEKKIIFSFFCVCVQVFASALAVFGKRRIIIISGFIWKKTADNMHRGFGVGFFQFFWTHEIKPLITLMQAFHACESEHQRNQRFVLMGLELWKQSNSI